MFIPIAYGSNGGKSSSVAHLLKSHLEEVPGVACTVGEMNKMRVDDLEKLRVVVFVCSTTGDGECPYNMQEFWKELKRKKWNGMFTNLHYSVICLGDSSYACYNYAGKRLFNRMEQLGATSICKKCECDDMDDMGVYSSLNKWIPTFKSNLLGILSSSTSMDTFEVFHGNYHRPISGALTSKKRVAPYGGVNDLTKIGAQYSEVLECAFTVDVNEYLYMPGDVLAIYPINTDHLEFVKEFVYGEVQNPEMFKALDYLRVPMLHHIQKLYQAAVMGTHARFKSGIELQEMYLSRLKEVSESYDEYYSYIVLPQRTFKEVLRDFYLTIASELQVLESIMPRYYTISKREGTCLSITAGIVKRKTLASSPMTGLCSKYLTNLSVGSLVRLDIKKSLIDTSGDLLMICTGTGISLARATINEYLCGRLPDTASITLLFGFRSLMYDFLHYTELCNDTSAVVQKDGSAAIEYLLGSVEHKSIAPVRILAVPSRLKADIPSLTQLKNTPLRTMPHIEVSSVLDNNYIQQALRLLNMSEFGKSIIISGNTRLSKTLPKIIREITKTKVHVQSECW